MSEFFHQYFDFTIMGDHFSEVLEGFLKNLLLFAVKFPELFHPFRAGSLIGCLLPVSDSRRRPNLAGARGVSLGEIGAYDVANHLLRATNRAKVGNVLAIIRGFHLGPRKRRRRDFA